jgi:hypothetical protein
LATQAVEGSEVKRRLLLIAAVVTLGLGFYAVAVRQAYTWRGNTHPDFYIEWVGSRVALQGGNPYGEETTRSIQIGSKGQEVPAGEDQLAFVYPYYRVLFNAPIAFLPYDWAAAIWQTAMQAALLAGVLLFVRSLRWRASALDLGLVILVALFAYPTFGGVMLGQMAVGVLALLLVAFWALQREHDLVAGGCLALATVKPQLAILAVPFLLLWSLSRRRWRVLVSFFIGLGILFGMSFLLYPPWLSEFLRATLRYPSYKNVQTGPGYLLSGCCEGIWHWLLELAGIVWLLVTWWFALRGDDRRLEGAFVLTMAMTSFLLPQTSIVNHLALLPAVLLLMRHASTGAVRIALAAVSIVGSWAAFAALYRTDYDLNMALPPLVVLLALAAWCAASMRPADKAIVSEGR